MLYDIGAYDMLYSEFKEMCCKASSAKLNYLCNYMTKNKEAKYRFSNESEATYTECICGSEGF